MLLRPGVDISRLHRPIRRSLNKVDAIFRRYAQEFIITHTYDGLHSSSSLHYSNDAYDSALPTIRRREIFVDIQRELGDNYDVIMDKDHYHIEHDPKKGRS